MSCLVCILSVQNKRGELTSPSFASSMTSQVGALEQTPMSLIMFG